MTPALNYLTARPTLELMLGLAGFEVPEVRPESALPIFVDFLALHHDPGMSDAGFQAEVNSESGESGVVNIILAARYPNLDPIAIKYSEEAPYRTVGLVWSYSAGDLTEVPPLAELWAGDFASQAAFGEAVVALPIWAWAIDRMPLDTDILGSDD